MCPNKNSPPPNHDHHEEEEEGEEIKPARASLRPRRAARKSRTRRRKPKYLSLRSSRLSAPNEAVESRSAAAKTASTMTTTRRHQLNLFPLHPELNAAEADHQSDDNVALLFESDGGATLNGLLTSADTRHNYDDVDNVVRSRPGGVQLLELRLPGTGPQRGGAERHRTDGDEGE
ncbi:hypothetical protein M0R45_033740 [Rubus argutus]|uniref:Uncharacterized protein n=1 Tax=Rubus argutus TaxID=59490 RepID=A0AAW1WNB3_RUBAR